MNRFSTDTLLNQCVPSTGNMKLDSLLFNEPKTILIYGEAASGKTNLVLSIFHRTPPCCSPLVYISTEGSSYQDRVLQLNMPEDRFFLEALSTEHLLDVLLTMLLHGVAPKLLVIDSINSFYRVSVQSFEDLRHFLSLLAVLALIREYLGSWIIMTAQVHETDEGVEPSGFKYIIPWVDVVCRTRTLEHSLKELRVLSPTNAVFVFDITEKGINWIY